MSSEASRDPEVVTLDEERLRRQGTGSEAQGHPGDATVVDLEALSELGSAGEMLRAARQALHLSQETCAEAINLPTARLDALEGMRVAELPPAAYVIGFVQSYAELLELPVQALADRYRREANFPSPTASVVTAKLAPHKEAAEPAQTSLFAVLVVLGVALYVIWRVLQAAAPDEPSRPPAGFPLAQASQPTVETETPELAVPATAADPTALVDVDPVEAATELNAVTIDADTLAAIVDPNATAGEQSADAAEANAPEVAEEEIPTVDEEGGVLRPGPSPARLNPGPSQAWLDRRGVRAAQRAAELEAEALAAAEAAQATLVEPPIEEAAPITAPNSDEPASEPAPVEAAEVSYVGPARTLSIEPTYPDECLSGAAAQEMVSVIYRVSRFGRVLEPSVETTTNDCFNSAALDTANRWSFTPAQRGGEAVGSEPLRSQIVFQRP